MVIVSSASNVVQQKTKGNPLEFGLKIIILKTDMRIIGVYWPFEPERNVPVECNSDESHTPGTFCVKVTRQGPRGFIWDGRWRMVIRRCASVSDTGVTGVCNWGVLENGVYWEECYCSHDGCNGSSTITLSLTGLLISFILFMAT